MIQHIFKIIWTERKTNLWIFIELVFIFVILWFCSDYLSFMYRRYLKPVGFDIENTYRLNFLIDDEKLSNVMEETGKSRDEIVTECGWTIFERVKRNPDIEYVAVSNMIYPYFSGNMSRKIFINGDSTKAESANYYGYISPEYFDVFKIPIERGRALSWDDHGAKRLILNMDDKSNFGKYPIDDVRFVDGFFVSEEAQQYELIGVSGKGKRDPFSAYRTEAYLLFPRELMSDLVSDYPRTPIVFRTKANMDTQNFKEKFIDKMYEQLSPDPLYLSSITSFEEDKANYMAWQDYDGNFKSIGAIVAFLLTNIFLGLIGTFWFRTRQRTGEIGLRMAIGSSRSGVKLIFVGETLLLVGMACIAGAIISINIGMGDVLQEIGIPMMWDRTEPMDSIQYILNFGITFFTLVIVCTLAVWYPAHQASQTQPAIALRDQ